MSETKVATQSFDTIIDNYDPQVEISHFLKLAREKQNCM